MIGTAAVIGPVPGWVVAVVAGGGLGLGLWLMLVALLASRPRLSAVLAAVAAPRRLVEAHPDGDGTGSRPSEGILGVMAGRPAEAALRVVLPLAHMLRRAGLPSTRIVADLRLIGRSPMTHLALVVACAVAGLAVPVLVSLPLAAIGAGWMPWWMWLAGGVLGFLLPDQRVRAAARQRRVELRRATGSVLDLAAIALAGGAGVEQALDGAAAIGVGWAHQRIRITLDAAHATRTDPWAALGTLGERFGVTELTELAATLHLAGTEGARVRASLSAKAAALRTRQQTSDEAAAASATERMSMPIVLLSAGYLVFVGYPALIGVLFAL